MCSISDITRKLEEEKSVGEDSMMPLITSELSFWIVRDMRVRIFTRGDDMATVRSATTRCRYYSRAEAEQGGRSGARFFVPGTRANLETRMSSSFFSKLRCLLSFHSNSLYFFPRSCSLSNFPSTHLFEFLSQEIPSL